MTNQGIDNSSQGFHSLARAVVQCQRQVAHRLRGLQLHLPNPFTIHKNPSAVQNASILPPSPQQQQQQQGKQGINSSSYRAKMGATAAATGQASEVSPCSSSSSSQSSRQGF